MWTRNFGFPTEWSASIGTNRAIVTMAATEPMKPAMYRVTLNGVHFGDFPSATLAKDALETSLAPSLMIVPAAVPDPPRAQLSSEASTTIGAALLSGRLDVQVTKETIASERQWSKYQRAVFDFVREGTGNAIIEAVAGSGKAQPVDAMELTPNGYVRMGDVRVGDTVIGRNGEHKTVRGVFPQGVKPVFRLTLANGASTECTDDHLWLVQSDDAAEGAVKRFAEVMRSPASYRVPMEFGGWSSIASIVAVGEKECQCISVGGDGLYVTDDGIVTHNSTTITEALRYIPADKSVLLLAFNKEAKKDLLVKVPKRQGLAVRTLVAQGYTFLREHWSAAYVSDPLAEMRDDTVIREAFGDDQIMFGEKEGKKFWKEFTDLVGLCQSYLASTDAEITFIQNDHGVLVDKRTESAEAWRAPAGDDRFWGHRDVLRWTKAALANQLREPRRKTKTKDGDIPFISFRDMVYVPAMNPDWVPPQLFDFVFVDETQDCDVAQLSLVMRSVKPGGRIIVVGDRRQCVAVDTMVTTPTGDVRADALSVGDPITVYLNGKNAEQTVTTLSPIREAECVRVRTSSGRTLTMSLEHRIWSTPPTLRDPDHMLVYLMYRRDMGFRVGVTNRGYMKAKDSNPYGNRMAAESASHLWVLEEVSSREEALQRETEYSLTYGIPTLVFNAENRGINQNRVDAIFAKFGDRGHALLRDKGYDFNYPHWLKRTASTANYSRSVVTLLSQSKRGSSVSVEGALDGEMLRAHGHSVTPRKESGWRVRKLFAMNCDAEKYAERLASQIGASLLSRLRVHGRDALQLTNAASLLVGMEVAVNDGDTVRVEAIESIERCRANVIDIGAGTANNFYGNGILSHNSIYRWRGADAEAMPRMQKTLNATMLPLYDSYRVTQCSAEEARRVVPHFDTPRDEHGNSLAMPGICKEISAFEMLSMWNVGDTVISRQNKVMIPLAMKALRDRKIPYIMGDEDQIPKALKSALSKIIKSMGGNQSIDAFREALIRWADAEREAVTKSVIDRRRDWERRMSKKWRGELDEGADEELNYVKVGTIEDAFWNQDGTGLSQMPGIKNANDLYAFIKEIAPTKSESSREKKELTPEQFKAMLAQRILITSVHRIKGGEGRRIFILEDTFKYNRGGLVTKQRLRPKEVTEEQNLWYVAVTRVKYERGNPAKGIPPRDGELYYVYGLEDLIGKFSMDDKDDE